MQDTPLPLSLSTPSLHPKPKKLTLIAIITLKNIELHKPKAIQPYKQPRLFSTITRIPNSGGEMK